MSYMKNERDSTMITLAGYEPNRIHSHRVTFCGGCSSFVSSLLHDVCNGSPQMRKKASILIDTYLLSIVITFILTNLVAAQSSSSLFSI